MPVGSAKTIKALSSMRGYVMAIEVLLESITGGKETASVPAKVRSGKHMSTKGEGWCAVKDHRGTSLRSQLI